ncbi:helix-turn-helix domain-containing protein [Acrocarpospora macrocephala]|uniref:Transcriptional regulator n=1 Tax=Acrocarpospora macrocephala TaxID=150177 RepID=A0A5M3WV57_9ACTN|nr:helix-turn-helix domain-containing protein [Acrocarpospora macrocephala]GES13347.1 transcriptional regulator [Acrocarpospora macrocephala]
MDEVYHVSDPRTLKAVAHPLRVRLLGALRNDGPATATELAARLGESSGATSYHLRQLARFGFTEEDPTPRDRRERRWRARHRYTSWSNAELSTTPEGREAAAFMRHRQLEVMTTSIDTFHREHDTWSNAWIEAAGMSDHVARLTPASVMALYERVTALIAEMEEHDEAAIDAEQVHVYMGAYPRHPESSR